MSSPITEQLSAAEATRDGVARFIADTIAGGGQVNEWTLNEYRRAEDRVEQLSQDSRSEVYE